MHVYIVINHSIKTKKIKPFVRFDLTVEDNKTTAFVGFPEEGTSGFDINFDANRLYGSNITPQMVIPEGENNLCIKAGSPLVYNTERIVPLNIENFIDGEYDLTISDMDNLPFVEIMLEDILTGDTHDFNNSDTYHFTANHYDDPNRFFLHFLSIYTGIDNSVLDNDIKIYSNDNKIYIQSKDNESGTVEIFDVLGRILFKESMQERLIIPVNDYRILFIRVIKNNIVKTKKVFIK